VSPFYSEREELENPSSPGMLVAGPCDCVRGAGCKLKIGADQWHTYGFPTHEYCHATCTFW
jgi:hypothetical protein